MMGCCTHIYYSKCLTVLACEASRQVANLTERKNPLTPVFGVKEFVCLSVCYQIQSQLSQDWQNRMG